MDTAAEGIRHDPARARQSLRYGREKGVRITIPKAALIAAGIDPDGPPPKYRTWGSRRGSVLVRFYRQ